MYDKARVASNGDALSMLSSMRKEYLSREEKNGGREKSEKSSQRTVAFHATGAIIAERVP